jgi:hypothetical protein
MVSFTPRSPYPLRKSIRYPLDKRLGGPQGRSGRRGEEKIIDSTGLRTPARRSSSPLLVAIPTALSRRLTQYQRAKLILNTLCRQNTALLNSCSIHTLPLRCKVLSFHEYRKREEIQPPCDLERPLCAVLVMCLFSYWRRNKDKHISYPPPCSFLSPSG